jgi:hypothetical protein
MEGKNDRVFDEVVTACRVKHLRDIMAFRKNWNNEIIAQLFATLYAEERGDTRKFHWMTERGGMISPINSLLGFLDSEEKMLIATRFTLHSVLMRAS